MAFRVNSESFKPSSYDADLTMNGTAQAVALADGVTKVRFLNGGATTEDIRVAFGTSAAAAQAALTMTTDGAPERATTGYRIKTAADGYNPDVILGVPAGSTHYAVANAADSDTQTVSVTQGN